MKRRKRRICQTCPFFLFPARSLTGGKEELLRLSGPGGLRRGQIGGRRRGRETRQQQSNYHEDNPAFLLTSRRIVFIKNM